MPSAHVWSASGSLSSPHFLNQLPPRAQQLDFPVLGIGAHLGHLARVIGRRFAAGPDFFAAVSVVASVTVLLENKQGLGIILAINFDVYQSLSYLLILA